MEETNRKPRGYKYEEDMRETGGGGRQEEGDRRR